MINNIIITVIIGISFISCRKDPTTSPINNLPDTTSHNFLWQIDSIGIYPSNFAGVWGTDINNVYAVGLIFYSYSPYLFTGIIHWDGTKWSSMDYHEGWLQDIYGFGQNDIWAVGYWQVDYNLYALITHWNGITWTTWKLQQYSALSAVWGTDSSNVFVVGAGGLILHYDGSSWKQQSSGTTLSLSDIMGFDDKNIFSCGNQTNTGTGVLIKYDGSSWKPVTNGVLYPDSLTLFGELLSVWGSSLNKLYLVGSLSYEGIPGNWKLSDIPYNSPGPNLTGLASMNRIRGSSDNNIFICGSRDLIIHWNGKSWNIYYQFFDKTKQSDLHGIWVKDKRVFIAGYENGSSQAIVYRGSQ